MLWLFSHAQACLGWELGGLYFWSGFRVLGASAGYKRKSPGSQPASKPASQPAKQPGRELGSQAAKQPGRYSDREAGRQTNRESFL